jgi:hypothetical protein
MSKVEFKVRDHAVWQIPMDVTGAPDTSNPEVPSFGMVRPTALGLGLMPNAKGVWEVTSVGVHGPKVKDGKVATKRDYSVMFMDPLGEDSVAPEWVREICQEWADRANGVGSKPAPAPVERERSPQRQSFDTALNVLLIRENLNGTEWAIEKLREMAEGPELGAAGLHHIADGLAEMIDKRTAELAARGN